MFKEVEGLITGSENGMPGQANKPHFDKVFNLSFCLCQLTLDSLHFVTRTLCCRIHYQKVLWSIVSELRASPLLVYFWMVWFSAICDLSRHLEAVILPINQ